LYTPILATLGYILSHDGSQVLMIHRNKRPEDTHYGKYNGLGGRIEPDEHVTGGMKREIFEEAGIHVESLNLRGTISWPGFGKDNENWFGFIYLIDKWSGEPHEGNHEGTLEWVPVSDILKLPLWDSDRLFLPMVFDGDPRPFHGVMPYKDGDMVSWSFERL